MPTPLTTGRTRYAHVPIDLIFPDPDQPRRDIPDADVDRLADSIRAVGVKEPVILRLRPGSRTGYYLVAGESRWLAVRRLAGDTPDTRIPAVIREDFLDDDEAFESATISNLARNDMDPFDVAAALRRIFHARRCRSNAALAAIVGRSVPWVGDMLVLNELPEEDRARVRDGSMTRGEAVAKAREVAGRVGTPHRTGAGTRARPAVEAPIRVRRGFGSGRDPWHGGEPPPPPGDRSPLEVPFRAPTPDDPDPTPPRPVAVLQVCAPCLLLGAAQPSVAVLYEAPVCGGHAAQEDAVRRAQAALRGATP